MTRTLRDVVDRAIVLADRARQYWSIELPKAHPQYPVVNLGEGEPAPPPEEQELRTLLEDLSSDEIYALVVLMSLGRGEFGLRDLPARQTEIRRTFDKPEWAVSQMVGKESLGDDLADGLEILRKNHISVESLVAAPVGAP